MGSQNSVEKPSAWEIVTKTPDVTVLRNKETQMEYQEYRRLIGVSQQYAKERKKYEQRSHETADNVVKVEKWKGEEKKELCATFYSLLIYIERFEMTMQRVSDLSFKDCLYLLLEILSATSYLLKDYPEFVIDESKIFITKNGTVKVWINENPAENEPSPSKYLDSEEVRSQCDLVQIIFDIIESRSQTDELPGSFIKPVRFSSMGLDEAISHIKLYCFEKKIKIASSMQRSIHNEPKQNMKQSDNKTHTLTNTRVTVQKERSVPQSHSSQPKGRPNNFSVLNYVAEQYGKDDSQSRKNPPDQNCKPIECQLLRR